MKQTTFTLTLAAVLATGAFAVGASAQSAGEAAGAAAMSAETVKKGDADGAFVSARVFSEPDGEKMYRRVCAGCHMPDAKGAVGAGMYPALAGDKKLAAAGYPVYVLTHGLNGMPALGKSMSDQQVADVVNYVRTNFGNKYKDKVKPEDVKAVR
jgi:mono/diheme cytochrome c family protein